MMVTTKALFQQAYGRYAIGAYNVKNLEQTMGLFRGNLAGKAPFIVQLARDGRAYTHKRMLEGLIRNASDLFPEAVFAVHLDHGDEPTCMDCIESGIYTSVMIDASDRPLAENIVVTKRVVAAAHAQGISVEAELGVLGGAENGASSGKQTYTRPEEAEVFVRETGCDSLACAIGTAHGAFKFSGEPGLRLDILENIQKRLPKFPLVLHGASSVPQEEIQRINAAGGRIEGARGVDADQFLEIAKRGISKINIDTDGRLIWCRVHREFFRDHPCKFDFADPGETFISEYAAFVAAKSLKLGSAGRLDEVRTALSKGQ